MNTKKNIKQYQVHECFSIQILFETLSTIQTLNGMLCRRKTNAKYLHANIFRLETRLFIDLCTSNPDQIQARETLPSIPWYISYIISNFSQCWCVCYHLLVKP